MPASYNRLDIRFIYPENWIVSDEQFDEWPHGVTLHSPGGVFWEVQLYPADTAPEDLVAKVREAMQEVYADLESQEVTEELVDSPTVGLDLRFFCLDFLVTAHVRSLSREAGTYLFIYQAESREFDRQEAVFRAITQSLLTSQAG